MGQAHTFTARLEWSGASAGSTANYNSYKRSHQVHFPGRASIEMSAAPQYLGDGDRLNPEELFVAAISSCQMLTYLALAARAGIEVLAYADESEGTLAMQEWKMRMTRVILKPEIVVAEGTDPKKALDLFKKAHENCFIANSATTEVILHPKIILK